MKPKIYTLKTCDSCRKATIWLRTNGIPYEEIAIRNEPPRLQDLAGALKDLGDDVRKLFNTSGQDYRTLHIKETLPTLSKEQALELLATNGNLIKRPFLITGKQTLVGFNPSVWQKIFLTDH